MSTFWIATVIMLLGGIVAFWWRRDISEGTHVPAFAGCLVAIIGVGSVILGMTFFIWKLPHGNPSLALIIAGCMIIYATVAAFLYGPFIASLLARGFDSFLFSAVADGGEAKRTHDIALKLESEEAYSEAVHEYRMAITENPDDLDARVGLAKVYCEMEDYDKAIWQYEDLLLYRDKMDMDQHCMILNRLADLNLTGRDNTERGKYWLEQILGTYPETKYATFAKQRLQRIDSQDRDGSRHSAADA